MGSGGIGSAGKQGTDQYPLFPPHLPDSLPIPRHSPTPVRTRSCNAQQSRQQVAELGRQLARLEEAVAAAAAAGGGWGYHQRDALGGGRVV